MGLPDVSGEVVHGNVLVAVRTPRLLAQVNALNVVVQQLLGLELLLAVGTLVVTNLLVEILDVVIQILILLVTDVTSAGLGQVNLLDVVLQSILSNKLLFTQRALSDLGRRDVKITQCFYYSCLFLPCYDNVP